MKATCHPKVSIIIPSYNFGHHIGETIRSVQEQVYSNWECIIVDDGSTDNTADVAQLAARSDDRIIYIHQGNAGVSAARNAGMAKATGDYLLFLDADDKISKEKLAIQVDVLENNPEIDISYSATFYFHNDKPEQLFLTRSLKNEDRTPRINDAGFAVMRLFVGTNIFQPSASLMRRSAVKVTPWFKKELKAMEDWDFFLRLAFNGCHFAYCDNPAAFSTIRIHDANATLISKQMSLGACYVRHQINQLIDDNETLSTPEKKELLKLNRKKSIKCCRTLFLNNGINKETISIASLSFSKTIWISGLLKSLLKQSRKI